MSLQTLELKPPATHTHIYIYRTEVNNFVKVRKRSVQINFLKTLRSSSKGFPSYTERENYVYVTNRVTGGATDESFESEPMPTTDPVGRLRRGSRRRR